MIDPREMSQMAEICQQNIIEKTGVKPVECSYNKCIQMCHTAPCVGTPFEMYRLATDPEFSNKIAITMNLAGIKIGLQPILMIVPVFNEETKSCAFLENEKCVLHDKGLKPLEGKLASCEQDFRMTKETELIFESWIPLQKTLIEKFSKKSYR